MALFWRSPNLLLEQANSFHLLVMRLAPSTIKASSQFMLMWSKFGCKYKSFFPLNVWWQDQVFMQALMHEGILMKDLIGKKKMTFGVDGVLFFKALSWC
jgi:hypothetical protein